MRHHLQSALLLGLASLATAIFQDEVGDVDFHHSLVGIPQVETTFFHRPRRLDKASLLYTLSDLGVIGAVNPSSGDIVWRQQISDNTTAANGHLRAPEGENWLAAAQGRRVQTWNAQTGRNVWQTEFEGEVKDLEIMELTENSRKDVLVLSDEDGTTVLRRIHGGLGTVVWEFRETSKDAPLQVSNNIASIYVLSLHGSSSSYSVKTTSLDPATGRRVDHWTVGTKGDVHNADDVMFVGANSAAPIVAWTNSDRTKVSVQVIGNKSKQDFALPADTVSVNIHAPHQTQSQPHFLVHAVTKTGNKAEVYHVDVKSSQISKAFELPHLAGHGSFSTSSQDANVYFTRVTEEEVLVVSSESHAVLARWALKLEGGLQSVHSVSEVVRKAGSNDLAVRTAVVTDAQDWIMIRNGERDWTRVEGLSGAVAAAWADIPEAETLAKVLAEEAHTNPVSAYIHRVTRHISDLQHLPAYLIALPDRIRAALLGGEPAASTGGLTADAFGFNKVIVIATQRGRFYGLDTGNHGEVLWSKSVLPQAPGQSLDIKALTVLDDPSIVAARGSKGESVLIRATDGHVIDIQLSGFEIATVAIIKDETSAYLLPFDSAGTPATEELESVTDQTVVIREGDNIKGVKLTKVGDKIAKRDVWQLQSFPGQKIADLAALPAHDPIASIGRVLGDRRVSYKYINPNTVVAALAEEATSSLIVQLIDSVSGQILASQKHEGVDLSKDISCTMSENWYACTFYGQYTLDDGSNQSIKGYQIAVSDLYESPTPNDRGPLGETDKFSSLNPVDSPSASPPLPWVVSQSWIISQPLTSLSVTQTRQGIANRQIVAYLPEAHSVLCMPRMYVDPRRPVGRDPSAAEMEAEGLPKYTPAIEIDSRGIVSHEWDVIGIKGFVAAPAVVESTSLLVAYGIDIYGTRVSPSGLFDILGKGFSKLSLVITVWALTVGVLFLAPMVSSHNVFFTQ